MYFCYVVVDGFASDLAVMPHDDCYAWDGERTSGGREAGEITAVCSGCNPFNTYLVSMYHAVNDIDLQVSLM
jgi:hypothetical protein